MSSTSVTTSDGKVIVSTDDDGMVTGPATESHAAMPIVIRNGHLVSNPDSFTFGVHSNKPLDGASFMAGLMLGALLYLIIQTAMRWHARREIRSMKRAAAIGPQTDARDQDGMAAAVAALARRTATLETIITDPAQRTAREIEALR